MFLYRILLTHQSEFRLVTGVVHVVQVDGCFQLDAQVSTLDIEVGSLNV
jgi:hypothetical protein